MSDGGAAGRMLLTGIAELVTNDPMMGVFRHADAGYELAQRCADDQKVNVPMRNWK